MMLSTIVKTSVPTIKTESREDTLGSNPPKRRKKVMNLEQKVKILDLLMGGMTTAAVSRKYGINESTTRCIRGQEEKIRLLASKFPAAKRAQFSKREVLLTKMEGLLVHWIAQQSRWNGQPNSKLICEKALEFFHEVKSCASEEEIGEGAAFSASRGWYNNFRKRHLLDPSYMLSKTLGGEMSDPPLDVKDEAVKEDEDGDANCMGNHHREEFNVYMAPMTCQQTHVDESDTKYSVNQAETGNPNEEFRHFIVAHDSEPWDNEVDIDSRCGQSSAYPGLTIRRLQGLMAMATSLKEVIIEFDPDPARSSDVYQKLESAMLPYKELLSELKERAAQPRITDFFQPVSLGNPSPSDNARANSSLSGGNCEKTSP